ncbi:hypothetical protein CRYUN_Cryun04dG0076700 [Craigia yunnanensis]
MALTSPSLLSPKSPLLPRHHYRHPLLPAKLKPIITAIHSADPTKSTKSTAASTSSQSIPTNWNLDSWKSKKALQLPDYPDQNDLDSVLQTLSTFPPIVFAGEARSLEEKLGQAALGNAFLL